MPPILKALAQLIVVMVLLLVKLAMSAILVVEVDPGNVPAPVLQLFVVPPAIQLLLVGVASQVALAAWAEGAVARAANKAGKNIRVREKERRIRSVAFINISK
jgi:hypothetical protein